MHNTQKSKVNFLNQVEDPISGQVYGKNTTHYNKFAIEKVQGLLRGPIASRILVKQNVRLRQYHLVEEKSPYSKDEHLG